MCWGTVWTSINKGKGKRALGVLFPLNLFFFFLAFKQHLGTSTEISSRFCQSRWEATSPTSIEHFYLPASSCMLCFHAACITLTLASRNQRNGVTHKIRLSSWRHMRFDNHRHQKQPKHRKAIKKREEKKRIQTQKIDQGQAAVAVCPGSATAKTKRFERFTRDRTNNAGRRYKRTNAILSASLTL